MSTQTGLLEYNPHLAIPGHNYFQRICVPPEAVAGIAEQAFGSGVQLADTAHTVGTDALGCGFHLGRLWGNNMIECIQESQSNLLQP